MFLADARLPVAGHTLSNGLEPAVASGFAAARVPAYLAARIASVTRVEAATAVVALHRMRLGLKVDDVETAWAARTPSAAMRRTSRLQARALLRLIRSLWPHAPGLTVVEHRGASRAVVLAAAADACGLPAVSLGRLVGYDDVQTVAAAALKLLPLDPMVVSSWVHAALPAIDEMASAVATLTDPADIPVAGAPQIEAWAEAHAVTTRRLFSA